MLVFPVHIPAGRFAADQKSALGTALPEALHEALGIPAEDRFIALIPVPRENFSFVRGELQPAPDVASA